MRKVVFMVAILLCLGALLCFKLCAFNHMENRYKNEIAPDFTLQDLSGKEISLSDYEGKSVILFFWTTWCPHCRRALSTFNTEYKDLIASDIELLAIDIGEPRPRVENFISGYSIGYPMLLDFDGSTASRYGVVGIPSVILVSREGKIVSVSNSLPFNYKELFLK